MKDDFVAKARDGRLNALKKLNYRQAVVTNVLPLTSRDVASSAGSGAALRAIFRVPEKLPEDRP